jgi:hypothetical protein
MLVKLVMCTGAAAINDAINIGHDVKALREELFNQVLSSAYLVYSQVKLRTAQILLLVVRGQALTPLFYQSVNML